MLAVVNGLIMPVIGICENIRPVKLTLLGFAAITDVGYKDPSCVMQRSPVQSMIFIFAGHVVFLC